MMTVYTSDILSGTACIHCHHFCFLVSFYVICDIILEHLMNKKTIGLAMFIALGAALATGLATPSVYATTVNQVDWNAHEAPGGLGGVVCDDVDKQPGMSLDQICIHVAP
jgi:hypothetical protein